MAIFLKFYLFIVLCCFENPKNRQIKRLSTYIGTIPWKPFFILCFICFKKIFIYPKICRKMSKSDTGVQNKFENQIFVLKITAFILKPKFHQSSDQITEEDRFLNSGAVICKFWPNRSHWVKSVNFGGHIVRNEPVDLTHKARRDFPCGCYGNRLNMKNTTNYKTLHRSAINGAIDTWHMPS